MKRSQEHHRIACHLNDLKALELKNGRLTITQRIERDLLKGQIAYLCEMGNLESTEIMRRIGSGDWLRAEIEKNSNE